MPRPKRPGQDEVTPKKNGGSGNILQALLSGMKDDVSVNTEGTLPQNINDKSDPIPAKISVTPNNFLAGGTARSMQNQMELQKYLAQQNANIQVKAAIDQANGLSPIEVEKNRQMGENAVKASILQAQQMLPINKAGLQNAAQIQVLAGHGVAPDDNATKDYIQNTNPSLLAGLSTNANTASQVAQEGQPYAIKAGVNNAQLGALGSSDKVANFAKDATMNRADLKSVIDTRRAALFKTMSPDQIDVNPLTGEYIKTRSKMEGLSNPGGLPTMGNLNKGTFVRNKETGELMEIPDQGSSAPPPPPKSAGPKVSIEQPAGNQIPGLLPSMAKPISEMFGGIKASIDPTLSNTGAALGDLKSIIFGGGLNTPAPQTPENIERVKKLREMLNTIGTNPYANIPQ